ncbi:winged helix-turn-helix domain-containing protein [Paludibaculum fermentans]|uniref:Winged helix-turn-helix domain-containing protein n=1 Tax=Paludibaculum fermentans TaxID=1473598 RepID=A0A7S7NMJ0_PALFE|nr:winged helix-turn-helix domain-containing protein [Paludibaculum fermentans]QOY85874.1 winged helix-turn-helix domain-containing protein [Paludibaculum fermentans]
MNSSDLRRADGGAPAGNLFRFGVFDVDLEKQELRRKGVPIKLQQQPFEILKLLLVHRGRFVSRQEIQRTLWPDDYFVDFEGSINTAVMKLRQALRENAASPTYIETVARKGYRLMAPILEEASAKDVPGIAVLPLRDLSGNTETQYFADGLTDMLITELAQQSGLRVISHLTMLHYRESSLSLRQIAQELEVQSIVEGSILRSGDRIRISVRLLDAQADRHLWAQTYDRDLRDILFLQREVAQAIVTSTSRALRTEHAPEPVRISPTAYEAYLKANYLLSVRAPKSLMRAIDWFLAAIAEAPSWAAPFAGLAETYRRLDFFEHIPSQDAAKLATSYAVQALALDPAQAQAHATMGAILALHDWNWKEGEERLKAALDYNPQSAHAEHLYAMVLLAEGRHQEALQHVDRALAIEPSSLFLRSERAQILLFANRSAESLRESEDLLEGNSEFALGLLVYAAALLAVERYADALAALERAYAATPLPIALTGMIHAYSGLGRSSEARDCFRRLAQLQSSAHVRPVTMALGYLGLGERDQALQWLEKAAELHDVNLPLHSQLPPFDTLRAEPAFARIHRQMNLPREFTAHP